MQSPHTSPERPDHVACARCGTAFECCARSARPCWCMALPPLNKIDTGLKGCMCPACLNDALARQAGS